eukprot:4297848-Prymnesium_polylepis.1
MARLRSDVAARRCGQPIFALSAGCISLGYMATKIAICKWYRNPPSLDEEMMEQMRSVRVAILGRGCHIRAR